MAELRLRTRLVATDRPGLARLLAESGAFRTEEVEIGLELVDETLSPGPSTNYAWVLAEVGSELVGFACHGPVPMTDGTHDLYWLAVAESHRGSNVATRLEAAVEIQVRARGGRWLLVETSNSPRHARALGFYAKRGYASLSEIPDYYRVGESRIVMGKRLDRAITSRG